MLEAALNPRRRRRKNPSRRRKTSARRRNARRWTRRRKNPTATVAAAPKRRRKSRRGNRASRWARRARKYGASVRSGARRYGGSSISRLKAGFGRGLLVDLLAFAAGFYGAKAVYKKFIQNEEWSFGPADSTGAHPWREWIHDAVNGAAGLACGAVASFVPGLGGRSSLVSSGGLFFAISRGVKARVDASNLPPGLLRDVLSGPDSDTEVGDWVNAGVGDGDGYDGSEGIEGYIDTDGDDILDNNAMGDWLTVGDGDAAEMVDAEFAT